MLLDCFFFSSTVFRIPGTRATSRILAMLCIYDSSSAFKEDASFTAVMSVG